MSVTTASKSAFTFGTRLNLAKNMISRLKVIAFISAGVLLFQTVASGESSASSIQSKRTYFKHTGPKKPFRELPQFRDHDLSFFAMAPEVNCPVSVVAEPGGAVYVLCDGNAGLGRLPNQGKVWRLVDEDDDGKADYGTEFIPDIDTPRGGHFVDGTLYLVHPPFVSAFMDTNADGVADARKTLARGFAHDLGWRRGGDHTTNDLRVGIDGWIYVAVGDFGGNVVGSDGSEASLMSGGVIRMRIDGSDVEVYTQGTRNTYDLAINHRLDMLAMDNTNDGGGWDMRLHHLTPLAHMGYPNLYKNFSEDAMAPLFVYGGGSGCGALYLEEPGFPDWFNRRFHTISWGKLHTHSLTSHEATFVNEDEISLTLNKLVDLDVDGSSRIYFANFEGGGARIEPDAVVGHVVQAKPKGWQYREFPELASASTHSLVEFLDRDSAVLRQQAQWALIRSKDEKTVDILSTFVESEAASLEARLAALYAVSLRDDNGSVGLLKGWLKDDELEEYALRALLDRRDSAELDLGPIIAASLESENPRVRLHGIVGARKLGLKTLTGRLLGISKKEDWAPLEKGVAHVHKIVPHTAQRALIEMAAVSDLHQALANPGLRRPALLALRQIHTVENVAGLISALENTSNKGELQELVAVLLRLYHREAEWDGETWWGTRPNSAGPYFLGAAWEGSEIIAESLRKVVAGMNEASQKETLFQVRRHNLSLEELQLPVEVDPLEQLLEQSQHTFEQQPDLLSVVVDSKRPREMRVKAFRAALDVTGLLYADWAQANLQALEKIENERDLFDVLGRDFVQTSSHRISLMQRVPKAYSKIRKRGSIQVSLFNEVLCNLVQSPLTDEGDRNSVIRGLKAEYLNTEFLDTILRYRAAAFAPLVKSALKNPKLEAKAREVLKSFEQTGEERVGELSVVDASKAVLTMEGSIEEGREWFTRLSCIVCHAISPDEPQKGPYLGSVGNLFNRQQLITHVIDPGAEVAQGFQTYNFELKDGSFASGFVTARDEKKIELRNVVGIVQVIQTSNVVKEEVLKTSMMPAGLVNSLTVGEFASLIDYLQSLH